VEVFGRNTAGLLKSVNQRICGVVLNVDEQNAGSLQNQSLDDGLPDSAGASGDKNNLPFQAAIHSGG
jgi:hypothetical protein